MRAGRTVTYAAQESSTRRAIAAATSAPRKARSSVTWRAAWGTGLDRHARRDSALSWRKTQRDVLFIVIQDAITPDDTARAFEEAGLAPVHLRSSGRAGLATGRDD